MPQPASEAAPGPHGLFVRSLTDSLPLQDFDQAVKTVLGLLHDRLGLGLWMVTRTVDDDWIVLASEDTHYGVGPGTLFRWTDSFCSRMVRGEGPVVAPDAQQITVYREAGINALVEIGAYIGVPLTRADGALFGTLCAIDPKPMPAALVEEADLVMTLAQLLSTILGVELRAAEEARAAERARSQATTDHLTGLANRRGWSAVLELEEARCARFGSPAGVVLLDLDGLKACNDRDGHDAGDHMLRRAADVLRTTVRDADFVARLGGDEFGVLAVEVSADELRQLVARVGEALDAAGLSVSIGSALRVAGARGSLERAQRDADAAMYDDKRRRRRPALT